MAINHATTADASFSSTGATEWNKAHVGLAGDGGFAFKYTFDTGTGNNPASGEIRYDNATPASVTNIFINETEAGGTTIDTYLDTFSVGDWLLVSNQDRTKFHVFQVSSPFTSGAGVDTLPVTYQFGTTLFSDADVVFFSRQNSSFSYNLGRAVALNSFLFT